MHLYWACHCARSLLNRVSCVPCMPPWSTCLRANVPKACQHFIFTCQRANKRANVPNTCQFFILACQPAKDVPIFETGVPTCQKEFEFEFLTFACFSLHVLNLVSLTYYAQHKSYWKSIHHVSWLRNYSRVLGNIVIINGKNHSQNNVSYNYLGSPTQADHNSRRSQYSHVFFILFSCFSS